MKRILLANEPARADEKNVVTELLFFTSLFFGRPETVTVASVPSGETEARMMLPIADPRYKERPVDAQALLRDLNAVRAASRLAPVALDQRLCEIARAHAADMAVHKYFAHTSLDGKSPFDRMNRAGYHYGWAGENIALGSDEPSAHSLLMRSNDHRDNMLESHYAKVGIAAVQTDQGEIFVEDFSD